MNTAANSAAVISFADLIFKYGQILSTWKDAPPALRRIRETLASLSPILVELKELHNLSQDALISQGINIVAFERDLKALDDLANDMLGTEPKLKPWKRMKWTLQKNDKAIEMGKRLDSHLGVFTFVLMLANRKSAVDMKEQVVTLVNSQPALQATMLEVLDITRLVNKQLPVPVQESSSSQPSASLPPNSTSTVKPQVNVIDISAGRVLNQRHTPPCPGADPEAPEWSFQNCNCNDHGLAQVRYRSSTTVAPHSGRHLHNQYLVEADFTTWKTLFGQFRFLLSVKAKQQAWSLSFPTISFSKQNIVSLDAPIFKLAEKGDFSKMLELFRMRLASPNDRTIDGRTPLLHAAHADQFETVAGLINEGADVNAVWSQGPSSVQRPETVLFHSVFYGKSDEVSTLLLERGADPFWGPDSPEVLFEKSMISAGNQGAASPPKRRTLLILGNLLGHPKDSAAEEDMPNPLQLALKWGSLEGTQIALRAGYDVNAPMKWREHPYEPAPRPTFPAVFSATRIHSRSVWHDSGPDEPNRGPILRELVRYGADLKLADIDTGYTVLHHVLSGRWWEPSYCLSYVVLSQLIVFLINNGADPRAVDVDGRSPSDVAWERIVWEIPIQRRVILWYRALRMCGLNPAEHDSRYDSRFDISYRDCYFCAFDAGAAPVMDFVACPWCIGEPYGIIGNWDNHDNWRHRSNPKISYSSMDNLDKLGRQTIMESELHTCCPMFACLWHYPRASTGVRLPKKPRRPMKPYSGLTPNSSNNGLVVDMLRAWGIAPIPDPMNTRYAAQSPDQSDVEEEETEEAEETEEIEEHGRGDGKKVESDDDDDDDDEDEFYDAVEVIES
ncbi:ankyrin repeat-containing domain protein [Trichophaea hybrida]|nr:ankyrin repeat-containing domain protein [Trichophaea hybrida]